MSELPGRALPVGIATHVVFDILGFHAFIIVPGFVVFAHVIKAELVIVTQLAILGRAEFTMAVTARPITIGQDRFIVIQRLALVAVSSVHLGLYVLKIDARNIIRID